MEDISLTTVHLEKNGRPVEITIYKDWRIEMGALKVHIFIEIGGENGLKCPAVVNISIRKIGGNAHFWAFCALKTRHARFELIRLLGEKGTNELIVEAGEKLFSAGLLEMHGPYHEETGYLTGYLKKTKEETLH